MDGFIDTKQLLNLLCIVCYIIFSVEKLKESPEVQKNIIESSYKERYGF